ncbi:MAG: AhpC/TSA family protein [Marinilabiliales bacterium]|nr:MAG: AhpC/TSA family protein [Marinilabiliales bacterium]
MYKAAKTVITIFHDNCKGAFALMSVMAAALFYSGCSVPDTTFSISGTMDNATGKTLYLYEMGTYERELIDSAVTGPDGSFSFAGSIENTRFMTISHNLNSLILIVSPGEDITVSADIDNMLLTARINGSPESELAAGFNRRMAHTHRVLDSISAVYRNSRGEASAVIEAVREKTRREFNAEADRMREFTIDFINRNPGSLASMMALYQQIDGENFILNSTGDFRYYIKVDSALMINYPDLEYTATFNENVRSMREQMELRQHRESMIGAGAVAPEISLPGPGGETVDLSSLRGSYVLLDFWASWCPVCREEIPHLADVYDRFGNEAFEIYQVSLDRSRERWLAAINDLDMGRWIHVSDLEFLGSPVVALYQIEAIPASFLLDPDGVIIARDLRGEALEQALAQIFE